MIEIHYFRDLTWNQQYCGFINIHGHKFLGFSKNLIFPMIQYYNIALQWKLHVNFRSNWQKKSTKNGIQQII